MKRLILIVLATVLAGACQQGTPPRPVPSVAQIGEDLVCSSAEHAFEDAQAGWGFCYPEGWRYTERAQGNSNPTRLDLTFDVTDTKPGCPANCPSCVAPTPVPGGATPPACTVTSGLFGFMIISTYERLGAKDLVTWMQTTLPSVPDRQAILWGDATEADLLADGRRIALTPQRVVIMELRSGQGQLNLESAMSTRLGTWKFLV
jgi:hypothetical protein